MPQPGRQARPWRDLPWVDLPAGGRGEWPDPPDYLGEHGCEWWGRNWATPAATQWGGEEFCIVVRRAELEDLWREARNAKVLAEMRHLDTALGLTAKARKELRWRIVDEGTEPEQSPKRGRDRRFRVVDGDASGLGGAR
jgi:hypothetical protein